MIVSVVPGARGSALTARLREQGARVLTSLDAAITGRLPKPGAKGPRIGLHGFAPQ